MDVKLEQSRDATTELPHRMVDINADAPHLAIMGGRKIADGETFLSDFKQHFTVNVTSLDDESLGFDFIGLDPSFANALRRIIISEIPTMAFETVYIWNNSSIIQDEVLSHRVGLIPIQVDPREFELMATECSEEATDVNTIVFKLDVKCEINPEFPNDLSKAHYASVYARDLLWVPQGNQEEKFTNIRPIHEDILLAKLRPGQAIAFEAHCRKGIGQDHAKFSPTATTSYRLAPMITLNDVVLDAEADQLVAKCPMNVFDIEALGDHRAVVKNPRACTMCRECIRDPAWTERISLKRRADHFIFTVETVGMLTPLQLVTEGLGVLSDKIDVVLAALTDLDGADM